jgi:signal transduction histidine kinase
LRIQRFSTKWNWSWGFWLFIALPALGLALLGLRAVRAERIEREQQLRETQTQLAGLIDAAISNKLTSLAADMKRQSDLRSETAREICGECYIFTVDRQANLTFPNQRVYFGDQSHRAPLPAIENLVEQAQAEKAQGRIAEAVTMYRRIIKVEPNLGKWAELSIAAIKYEEGDASILNVLANDELPESEAMTPTGLPLALFASAYVERMPASEQAKVASFIKRSLESLRHDRWWLSYDERSFYDSQLRRMLERIDLQKQTEDRELKQLAALEQIVRRSLPIAGSEAFQSLESAQGERFSLSWSKTDNGSTMREGFAVSVDRLVSLCDSVLSPLLSGQSFATEVRDLEGHRVWGELKGNAVHTQSLRGVRGLELAFGGLSGSRWVDQKQLLWVGIILLLVLTMIAGLAMTARVVRREMELGRMQNDFIAAVSHEFKSPIASIRLLMERITGGKVHSEQATAEYYAAIDRESERLERLVNRLLEWQQIQAGRRQYRFEPLSVVDVAKTAIAAMRPKAEAKQITIITRVDGNLPNANLDDAAFTDAIENLIDNAIKYSPPGTTIAVSCARADHHTSIEVRDQGVGIPADELPHIFDRFYRGRRGDTSNVHGTGLGLALVKATVEAHRGTVDVTSEPGTGSCFRLSLPINNGVAINGASSHS